MGPQGHPTNHRVICWHHPPSKTSPSRVSTIKDLKIAFAEISTDTQILLRARGAFEMRCGAALMVNNKHLECKMCKSNYFLMNSLQFSLSDVTRFLVKLEIRTFNITNVIIYPVVTHFHQHWFASVWEQELWKCMVTFYPLGKSLPLVRFKHSPRCVIHA